MIFAIPRGRITYIGTTDTPYKGDLDRVVVTTADLDYLLKAANNTFPTANLTKYDVISNWAGLRPLIHEKGKSPSEMSRKDEIFEAPDGLISIAGGKLTGYRKMAERIVDKVLKQLDDQLDIDFTKTTTHKIQLTDDPFSGKIEVQSLIEDLSLRCEEIGLERYYGWYLVTNYGKAAGQIVDQVKASDKDKEKALVLAELDYCLTHEMVQRADDFLVRRTGRLYFDILSIEHIKDDVIQDMSDRLDWTDERTKEERSRMDLFLQDASTYYEVEMGLVNEHVVA